MTNERKKERKKDDHNYLDDPISIDEVETTIKLLKSGKAPGPDRIRSLQSANFLTISSPVDTFHKVGTRV